MRLGLIAGLVALAFAVNGRALASCPPPPPLDSAPTAPSDEKLSWASRNAALKAERAWSQPRTAYGACRRAEIQDMGEKANALGAQANAIVEEWNVLDRKIRAARTAHEAVMRAYAQRRGQPFEDMPDVGAPASPGPPCSAPPSETPPPLAPNPAHANAKEMRQAEDAFQSWLAPREDYLACRRVEGEALANAFTAAKARYADARKDYAAYRTTFNASVTAFETGLDAYTRKLRARGSP